ncbi:hypothetical protein AKJ09_09982 [Labilithrix luteola]|uniref:Uncharacterized protein n=1 Tax=Labilithrix luteola TaxID=1391654 RepID=A0A0K1QC43_9BACT|nr:hypothetical protein AKJ09_09982 [Labilithrix luteola]
MSACASDDTPSTPDDTASGTPAGGSDDSASDARGDTNDKTDANSSGEAGTIDLDSSDPNPFKD